MMINALVTLRIEFFWQSVASGVVIITSVAFYTWLQTQDRDGKGGLLAGLGSPEGRKTTRFVAILFAVTGALFLLGWLFAGESSAVR